MGKNLDLYAKVEALIGFDEAYDELYEIYLKELENYSVNTILDLGCGNGNFLLKIDDDCKSLGIDLSQNMVDIAIKKGVNAKKIELGKLDEKFDVIVAIGDVLNYIKPIDLKDFFMDVERVLNDHGVFMCDLNTLHGFEEVTAGSMVVDREDEFLSIDAEYFAGVLRSEIIHFYKDDNCFKKSKGEIFQYYHDEESLKDATSLKLIKSKDICMFSQESDKTIFIFQKS
jgi:cyclopropane fatty-acyl-phospholipid synthase-like methyltransferase